MKIGVRVEPCLPIRVGAIGAVGLSIEPGMCMRAGTNTMSTSMNAAFAASCTVLAACAVFLVLGAATGCSDSGGESVTAFEPVAPELLSDPRFGVYPTRRVDAVLGLPLVIQIELAGNYQPEDVGQVVLDDGRAIETRVVWIGVKPGERSGSWLEPAGEWTARTMEEVAGGSVPRGEFGAWVILLDPPIDAVGQGLWIAGRRHSVNWLPDPSVVASRVSARAWLSPLSTEMRESQRLRFLVEPERRSPFRRWRYSLMVGEISPRVERRVVEIDGRIRRLSSVVLWDSGELTGEVLELLASQRESKWAIGLARLDQADNRLAEEVRQRLCAIVDFGAGELAPLWPLDTEGMDRLLSDLLDQRLQPRERARRARLWLDDQATMAAWVVSDAPRSDAVTGASVSTIAVANMAYESKLASVQTRSAAGVSELSSLEALSARAYEVTCRSAVGEIPAVVTRVGDDERVLAVGGVDLKARPPGLRIDQFFGDWSLRTLQAGAVPAMPGGDSSGTGALLYREPAGRWMLYIECATPNRDQAEESIRVTLGPEGAPGDLVIKLSPGSEPEVEFERGVQMFAPFVPDVEIQTFPGGWYARLVVPERSIESNGDRLRLGLERIDGLGRRSAWPRPMLPWQGACGRAAVDLTTWGGLGR